MFKYDIVICTCFTSKYGLVQHLQNAGTIKHVVDVVRSIFDYYIFLVIDILGTTQLRVGWKVNIQTKANKLWLSFDKLVLKRSPMRKI